MIFIDDGHKLNTDEFLEAHDSEDLIFYVRSSCLNLCLDGSIRELAVICNSDPRVVEVLQKKSISETK